MAGLGFVAATNLDVFSIKREQPRYETTTVLGGEEARHFYENVMKDGHEQIMSTSSFNERGNGRQQQSSQRSKESRKRVRRRVQAEEMLQVQTHSVEQREQINEERDGNQRRETSNSERTKELQGLRLLRCAHEGDISGLKELLSKGADINFQDTFFWTAVMCASWSGQKLAVRLLLQQGAAWVGVVDTQGRDAKDLALEAGHIDVVEELENYGRSPRKDTDTNKNSSASQPKWCEVCRSTYSSSLSTHLSSTLHLFSLRRPAPTPYYCLPPSSNSYKMMVRCGWKPGTGLGPEGEGPKQPVPTVLKRDQKGLGYGQIKRAKVTHFQARDHDAVKPPSKHKEESVGKGKRREEGRRKEQKDKNWERDFRASFYL